MWEFEAETLQAAFAARRVLASIAHGPSHQVALVVQVKDGSPQTYWSETEARRLLDNYASQQCSFEFDFAPDDSIPGAFSR